MKMVYICSPLRGDTEANVKRAMRYCEYATGCGVVPIAPHVSWNGIFDDTIPEKRETALRLGIELLRRCDELWVMGNEITQGMQGEIDEAERLRMATVYILDEAVEQNTKLRQEQPSLGKIDCVAGSYDEQNFTGKILVLNPESLMKGFRNSDNSLWIATHGPGCRPGNHDRTVHATSLYTGEKTALGRYQFYGVVKPESLSKWLQDHPVRNQHIDSQFQDSEQPEYESDGGVEH